MSTEQDGQDEYVTKLNALRVAVDHLGADEYEPLIDEVQEEISENGYLEDDTRDGFIGMLFDLYDTANRATQNTERNKKSYELKQERRDEQEDNKYLVQHGSQSKSAMEEATTEVERRRTEDKENSYRQDTEAILTALELIDETTDDEDFTYDKLHEAVENKRERKEYIH